MTDSDLLLSAIKCTALDSLTQLIATYLEQPVFIMDVTGHTISTSTPDLPAVTPDWFRLDTNRGAFQDGTTEYLRQPINTYALKIWFLFVAQSKGYPVTASQLNLVIQVINNFNERYTVNPNQSEMNSLFTQLLHQPTKTDITSFGPLLNQPLVMITATPLSTRPHQDAFKQALQKQLTTMPMTEDTHQNLVLIVPATTAKFEQTALDTLGQQYQYCFFISEPYTDITKSRDFLNICHQAFKAAQKLGELHPVNLTQGYNIYIILDHMTDTSLLRQTMCAQLLTLKAYDRAHHAELFQTLFTYLENDCRLNTTATQLHLHRNSLTKRLQRIDDIIHIDWSQPHKTFGLRLSYRIFDYLDH
ncbi:helix-turn-helix domain-containing protein [Lactiplantibacillus sp. WILCCON 0030]|uniref:Helix-turn-helix domain-containing protein n=1 Tax=Lactiplantibacillus brownii TaxID=3069269 RepID=A0ABU1A910_9LACO|nr:helix-turn-helix domain-containing protein [Lactiplantibacillus brownii]MDQ7937444.1 helix-turn-helix domain-containing protein [Lactiplantibacillus brownii]